MTINTLGDSSWRPLATPAPGLLGDTSPILLWIFSYALTWEGTGMGWDPPGSAAPGGDVTGLCTGRVEGRLGLSVRRWYAAAPLWGLTLTHRRGNRGDSGVFSLAENEHQKFRFDSKMHEMQDLYLDEDRKLSYNIICSTSKLFSYLSGWLISHFSGCDVMTSES